MSLSYKVVVVGGGPGGYVAAIRAAQLGARVALVEKEELGGTCLNRGCIPTKVLAAGAALYADICRAADFGIETGTVKLGFNRLMERKSQVVRRLVQGIDYLLKKNKVDLFRGTARLLAPGRVKVEGPDVALIELAAENIILATGTDPALIPSLGYDGKQVITSDEALELDSVPERLVVIGGGVIGCEFASIFAALGAQVTIVEIMPAILPVVDKEAARQMQGFFKRRGVTVKTKVKVQEVKKSPEAVAVRLESGEEILADKVLISIGRSMNTRGLGLEECGVAVGDRGEVVVDERMETSVPGIYAVGDITGKIQLAHVASAQGLVAVENIMGRLRTMDYQAVPNCIFTRPEIAGVGLTTQEAEKKGISFKTGKFPFLASGKAQVMGETEGFVKVLADPQTDRVLGVHIVGPHATDLIAEAALAVQMRVTAGQLAATIHAHPTLAECLMEAAEAVHGMSIHA